MRERLGARNVIGGGAGHLDGVEYMLGRDKQKRCLRIDEAADQPRAGDAVDLRPFAGDPAVLSDRHLVAQRQFVLGPSGDAVFEVAGIETDAAQRNRDLLADLLAVRAVDDEWAVRVEIPAPMTDITG